MYACMYLDTDAQKGTAHAVASHPLEPNEMPFSGRTVLVACKYAKKAHGRFKQMSSGSYASTHLNHS